MITSQYIYNLDLTNKAEKETFKKTSSFMLMQKVSKKCYFFIKKNFHQKNILVICGPGNNGGDGVLIANHLYNNSLSVDVVYPFGPPKTGDAKKALKLLSNKKIIKEKISLNKYDLIIDALFGTGTNKPLSKKGILFINKVNKSKSKIISIDMPSGVFVDTGQIINIAVKADITLSLQRYKPGQWLLPGKEYSGKVYVLNIGLVNLDNKCNFLLNSAVKPPIPKLKDHKFSRGCCLIISGENLVGASKLTYLAASKSVLRSGAGVCKILVHRKNIDIFKPHILEEMILSYNDQNHLFSLIDSEKCDALIYGCGIDNNSKNREIFVNILKKNINLVLDASVFSMIGHNKTNFLSLLKKRKKSTVLTPHEGEFKRVYKISGNKINDSLALAKISNSIVVYKGNDTVIASPEGFIYINKATSPYLATAGSGDVLAGLIGGFLSQKMNALISTRIGCYIHSECGKKVGPGLIASDLVNNIPRVLKKII